MSSAQSQPVAVITGGTGGIGRATVREFVRGGYDVAVLARDAPVWTRSPPRSRRPDGAA